MYVWMDLQHFHLGGVAAPPQSLAAMQLDLVIEITVEERVASRIAGPD